MYTYIYIYIDIYKHIYIYIYIYKHIFVVFLQTTSFTIDLLSKRPEIYKIMAKTLLIIFPSSWGDPFARMKYGTSI